MKNIFKISLVLSFLVVGCKRTEPNIEIVQDMMVAPSIKAQGEDPFHKGKPGMRLPPEGTIPQGWEPYQYEAGDFDSANLNVKNPVPVSELVLLRGQKMYMVHCQVCHGSLGKGDGPVAPKMLLAPPSLVSEKIRGWNDGGIYHLITRGRGLMGQYESQIPLAEDRWAIVHYIRHLQKEVK